MDVLWLLLFIGVLVGLWYLAYRIDPHYSRQDGRRFVCNSQVISMGKPVGRMREAQVLVLGDGTLAIAQKVLMRRVRTEWVLVGRDETQTKHAVFLARRIEHGATQVDTIALRIPTKSRVVAVLEDAMATRKRSGKPTT